MKKLLLFTSTLIIFSILTGCSKKETATRLLKNMDLYTYSYNYHATTNNGGSITETDLEVNSTTKEVKGSIYKVKGAVNTNVDFFISNRMILSFKFNGEDIVKGITESSTYSFLDGLSLDSSGNVIITETTTNSFLGELGLDSYRNVTEFAYKIFNIAEFGFKENVTLKDDFFSSTTSNELGSVETKISNDGKTLIVNRNFPNNGDPIVSKVTITLR